MVLLGAGSSVMNETDPERCYDMRSSLVGEMDRNHQHITYSQGLMNYGGSKQRLVMETTGCPTGRVIWEAFLRE